MNAMLGSSDGGRESSWGRSYAHGGVLDVRSGTWSALPDPPSESEADGAAVLTRTGATYGAPQGYVLDMTTSTWLRVPALPQVQSRTVVAAGRDMFVFGGARFERADGRLLASARIWSPD